VPTVQATKQATRARPGTVAGPRPPRHAAVSSPAASPSWSSRPGPAGWC
jgi:hypothetical protein